MTKAYYTEERDGKLALIEAKTGFIMKVAGRETLRKLAKHLNTGGGFNGESPRFFITPKYRSS
jgi:hypothetical protein